MSRRALLVLCFFALACEPPRPVPTGIPTTYRALAGLSMGAIGTAALGFHHPEKFDALASLGGPLDAALLLRTIDHFHLGGFCTREETLAMLARGPDTLNDPAALAACARAPTRIRYENAQDYNHRTTSPNTPFDRSGYIDLFTDLTLAFGNLLTENPNSLFAPTGVDPARARRPPADFCTNPVRVKGLFNAEYNPDGTLDAITFCDGEPLLYFCTQDRQAVDFCADPANLKNPLPRSAEAAYASTYCASKGGAEISTRETTPDVLLHFAGRNDPCRVNTMPVRVGLAWDFNGNGRRDYNEPVVNNGEERYRDVGVDGCDNSNEDGQGGCTAAADPTRGDANGDDYDANLNPNGTEGNWKHDDGEPFSDFGLDGVPNTNDFGEGNGEFDLTRGRKALYAHDARTRLAQLDPAAIARFNLLLDGGIRDLFNFGLTAHQVYGKFKALRPDSTEQYRDFAEIPGMADPRTGVYRPWGGPWLRAPKNLLVLYGKENATEQDVLDGDGEHVGTNGQAVYRISTLFNFIGSQWPTLPRPSSPLGGESYDQRERLTSYDSAVLGARRDFGIFLPPGYELPENQDVRYPVLYLLHGYLGEPKQILTSAFLADTFMKDSDIKFRPMIIVTPSGACCFRNLNSGARDCREVDDAGRTLSTLSDWERECQGGSFFVDQAGGTDGATTRYEDSFFELMDVIDQQYRTLAPATVEKR